MIYIEALAGAVDGSNRIFSTPRPYVPGTVRVFRNGLLLAAALDDGWVELGSSQIQMKNAPIAGDLMKAYYLAA